MVISKKIFLVMAIAMISTGLYAIRIYEENGDVIVKMNVPYSDANNMNVRIERGKLHVWGNREEKREMSAQNYYKKEIEQGSFDRMISLPSDIDTDAMDWEVKDGTLTVTIPKIEE